MRQARFARGEVIVAEGDFTSDAYMISAGLVEVYRAGPPEQRLSVLGPGDFFGEMALITERSRSASVRALEDVDVRVVDRDAFLRLWRADPDAMIPLVAMLCERIRILDALVFELARQAKLDSDSASTLMAIGESALHPSAASVLTAPIVFIEGITPEAVRSLPEPCVPVNRFPFRIGRVANGPDPLAQNELGIADTAPYQISLNHCAIIRLGERYFLIDRGSRQGTIVNGNEIGGRHRPGCLELTEWTNEVALGAGGSPYRFRVTIVPPEMTRP